MKLPANAGVTGTGRRNAGAFMRYCLDENQLPPMPFPPTSDSLEQEFDSLLAKIEEVRKQFDEQIVAAEAALAAVHAMRNDPKIELRQAPR
jgi:hypothetical protein